MKLLTSAALASAVLVAAIGYSTVAPAAPAAGGARALDAAAQGTPVVQVQQRRGNRGAGNNNRGNNQNANRGGGNNNQADRDRRRKRDARNAAIAAGVVGVLGGLLLSQQAQPQPVYEERGPRCRYGSYVNRYGERRCRR